ncbi:MAG: hypothetical protein A3E07_02580 [Candidatus Wildermuthbacteria bacterium RIFCSPHIGHO2_12_FULL_45_9]|uniref:OmpR/PhoB-type domain-containing protein n=1 Tax=Candidatus Wildermuthbacteria bacterium RIFCSPHIGHO2_02_FULL_45_25 TaxID=1802450 RepID=A0A1G2R2U2_9BACT|nr:MAG: hypothetical protein A2748_03735 [Candidatus Wildermuthbacteria bacterium RIFCSPHIGHO2_01_FULL_45_20]OHA66572.1 MAG: hypothetical protein A3C04_04010 [Candidatus Wildermuthbacteria bacterium RIFCSPHIGHO2_02_FULL_45_25]OHA70713.1 MAG: hypothetical protein A3E07_02580 [Candidatus Wildermuthbacteria bacterium RIFCSPHIGHO2_12_FULL_45_9]
MAEALGINLPEQLRDGFQLFMGSGAMLEALLRNISLGECLNLLRQKDTPQYRFILFWMPAELKEGLADIRRIKGLNPQIPLICLDWLGSVAADQDNLRLAACLGDGGFSAKADNYIQCSRLLPHESFLCVIARIHAIVRRAEGRFPLGGIVALADDPALEARIGGIDLTARQKKLVEYLWRNRRRSCSYEELNKLIWDEDFSDPRGLKVLVAGTNKRMEKTGGISIGNVRGFGYQLMVSHLLKEVC